MLNDGSDSTNHGGAAPVMGPGTILGDRFVLEEEVDHGRFGTVFRASDVLRGAHGARHVALLVLPAEVARGGQLESFKRDFVRLHALSHPNIVKVFDFDRDGEVHFLTMEFVDGESLRSIVDSLRPELLWEREAIALIRAIGDALVYAHARGVVHGDVRLENVLITAQHDVKVLFTSSCLMNGAPFSMEPRDDVHGLASIAYELLSGEPPLARQPVIGWQRDFEPKRIKTLSRRQWRTLRAILMGRDDRMRTVSEFLADFCAARAAGSGDDEAQPATRSRGWRWVAAAWVVVLLGAGYVLTRDEPRAPEATSAAQVGDVVDVPPVEPALTQAESTAPAPPPNLDGRVPGLDAAAPNEPRPNATAPPSRAVAVPETMTSVPPPAAAGGVSTVTFAQSTITAAESEGAVAVELRRSGALEQPARVTWWTSEGTARQEDDYASFGQVVEAFRSGEEVRRLLIPITSDRLAEGREYFRVHLRESTGGNARLGAITQITVTLVDDDY
jgi:serine/threonine protein kinase